MDLVHTLTLLEIDSGIKSTQHDINSLLLSAHQLPGLNASATVSN
jgi:hypothetical protein